MDVVHNRCAGLDISKRDAKVCVRIQSTTSTKANSTITTWSSMTNSILELKDHLINGPGVFINQVQVNPDHEGVVRVESTHKCLG